MLRQGTKTLATQTLLQLSLYIVIRCVLDPLPNGIRAVFSVTYIYQRKNRLKFNWESLPSYLHLSHSLTPLISSSHSFISSSKQKLNYTFMLHRAQFWTHSCHLCKYVKTTTAWEHNKHTQSGNTYIDINRFLWGLYYYYLNCKWVSTRWQWYYNKTHHTNNTPRSNKTIQIIKDTLNTMNTIQIQLRLILILITNIIVCIKCRVERWIWLTDVQNVVEWVAVVLHISEVPGSNFATETCYPEMLFLRSFG
jgi:hypothetical protein